MEFLESKARLKRLAEAADIYVDSNIPIRSEHIYSVKESSLSGCGNLVLLIDWLTLELHLKSLDSVWLNALTFI